MFVTAAGPLTGVIVSNLPFGKRTEEKDIKNLYLNMAKV
jgi:23S rRNA G2445 N2-methylase RlmL